MKGFGTIPRRCGIRSKPQHKCKKLALFKFLEITIRAQDRACLRIVRVSFGLIFQNWFICSLKVIIFILTLPKSFNFWLGPKPTLGLKIQHHWGTGARVVKMRCLQPPIWLSLHFCILAYMFMHESLLACVTKPNSYYLVQVHTHLWYTRPRVPFRNFVWWHVCRPYSNLMELSKPTFVFLGHPPFCLITCLLALSCA